jgi:hypothetical protein
MSSLQGEGEEEEEEDEVTIQSHLARPICPYSSCADTIAFFFFIDATKRSGVNETYCAEINLAQSAGGC